jgi:hypothetical protein
VKIARCQVYYLQQHHPLYLFSGGFVLGDKEVKKLKRLLYKQHSKVHIIRELMILGIYQQFTVIYKLPENRSSLTNFILIVT